MRDVVGHLFEAPHQRFDALQHAIEVEREAVELIAAPGDPQPSREIARHDGLGGPGHGVSALEDAPAYEDAADDAEHDDERNRPAAGDLDDVEHALALVEV